MAVEAAGRRARAAPHDSTDLRERNAGRLLAAVHRDGPISRAELTRRLRLNRSTIHALVSDLSDLGLVAEEIPLARAGAGRPSHVVVPDAKGPSAIAAVVDVGRMDVAVVGIGGEIRARTSRKLRAAETAPAVLADLLLRDVTSLAVGSGAVSVAVSVPGVVRRDDGFVEIAPNLGWERVDFGGLIGPALAPLPYRIANDADLGALAEHNRGAGRGCDNLLYVAASTGVGAGIVLDGHLARGAAGYAGEIGHLTVEPDGLRCRCGNCGCLETRIGGAALIRASRSAGRGRTSVESLLAAADADDPSALAALTAVARWLGVGLGGLINLFNPEAVVLGGHLRHVLRHAGDVLAAEVRRRSLTAAWDATSLRAPAFGSDAPLIGAAELAFAPLLAAPYSIRRAV